MILFGNFLFRFRNALFPILLIAFVLFARPSYFLGSAHLDAYLDGLGVAVALLGQILRALTIGYAYIQRGGKDRQVYADELVDRGVFAHSRNPLYIGNVLIMAGLSLIINAKAVYLIGVPLVLLIYAAMIMAEEHYLCGKFGVAYEAYCRRVNRFWPRWRNFSQSISGMSFDWRRLIVKEYGTTFGWIASAIGLRMWSLHVVSGPAAAAEINQLGILLIPLAITYLIVRFMKKTHRLAKAV